MFVELEGKKINYAKSGKGNCIVFLHGFLENLTIWNDFATRFVSKYKVIQIDLPGHGKTDVFDKSHSMSLMAGAVDTVLEKEGISEAIIVGHSMGGYVAVEFAKQFRNKTKAVCLFNSSVLGDSKIKKEERLRVVKILQKNSARFIEEAIPNLFTAYHRVSLKELIDELILEAKENPIEGIVACTMGMRDRVDNLSWLKGTDVDVQFIVGRRDPIITFEKYKEQIFANPHIDIYISSHSGHMGFLEDHDGTYDALKNFCAYIYSAENT